MNMKALSEWDRLGARLKFYRFLKGSSQDECAEVINVSRTAYVQIESGNRKLNALELEQLANYFCISKDLIIRPFPGEFDVLMGHDSGISIKSSESS